MYKYTVIVEKGDGNYSAYCPDLPGCVATGKTVDDAIGRLREAIEFHLEGMKKEGLGIPKPTTMAKSIEVTV